MLTAQLLEIAATSLLSGLALGFSFRLGWLLADRLVKRKK